jgi:alpha-D-xyloside xylohydrolase
MNRVSLTRVVLPLSLLMGALTSYSSELGNYQVHHQAGRSIIVESTDGSSVRLTPYGDYMLRVQVAKADQTFTPDDRYGMVMSHNWPGEIAVNDLGPLLEVCSAAPDGYRLEIQKKPMRLSWFKKGSSVAVLTEKEGVTWSLSQDQRGSVKSIALDYAFDAAEHFAGSGGPDRDTLRPLDLKGNTILNEYPAHGAQFIPFFISSKGYGIFINSSFPTQFNFGENGIYRLSLLNRSDADFAMDYFYISGPEIMSVVQRYTDLTGKPRLFQRGFLGLQLSDRGGAFDL